MIKSKKRLCQDADYPIVDPESKICEGRTPQTLLSIINLQSPILTAIWSLRCLLLMWAMIGRNMGNDLS